MIDSVLLKDWHPLDGVPAPDYVPPHWDGPQVGKRLVEALRLLRTLPGPVRPQAYGTAWPAYFTEWSDRSSYEDDEHWKTDRASEWNARALKPRPSSVEIARMEAAIAWPGGFLAYYPQLLVTVQLVAYGRSYYREIDWSARRLHLAPVIVRNWNREGLDIIAGGLRRRRIPVF
jgi:hypothetical protein